MRVVLAADAGPADGLGHLVRSTALALALREAGAEVRTAALRAEEALTIDGLAWEPVVEVPGDGNVIVLDSYHHAAPAHAPLAEAPDGDVLASGHLAAAVNTPLVVFADDATAPAEAELVIAPMVDRHAPGWLTGLEHACLRPAFWASAPRVVAEPARRILVATGGTDPGGLGLRLAADLVAAQPEVEVSLVRGPGADPAVSSGVRAVVAPDDLAAELARADLGLLAAGQTALEAAATGLPCVAVVAVENQRTAARRLATAGIALVAEPDAAVSELRHLLDDAERRRALARSAQAAVDGQGARRIAARVRALAERP